MQLGGGLTGAALSLRSSSCCSESQASMGGLTAVIAMMIFPERRRRRRSVRRGRRSAGRSRRRRMRRARSVSSVMIASVPSSTTRTLRSTRRTSGSRPRRCVHVLLRTYVRTYLLSTHSLTPYPLFSLHSQAMDKLLAERRRIGKKSGSRKKR